MNRNRKQQQNKSGSNRKAKAWPGYMKNDGGFFAMRISEIADMFGESNSSGSLRVSRMLSNLAEAMIRDDQEYFLIAESCSRIQPKISMEWNGLFRKNGGRMGSGQSVTIEPDEKIMGIISQYPPVAFNTLQQGIQVIKSIIKEHGKSMGAEETERLNNVWALMQLVHQSIILNHWFDKVESAINNPVPTHVLN